MCLVYFFLVQKYSADIQWILSGYDLILWALHILWIHGPCTSSIWGVLVSVKLATVQATEASQTAYCWGISIPVDRGVLARVKCFHAFTLATKSMGLPEGWPCIWEKKPCDTVLHVSFHTVSQSVNNHFLSTYLCARRHSRLWDDKEATRVGPSKVLQFICQFIIRQMCISMPGFCSVIYGIHFTSTY